MKPYAIPNKERIEWINQNYPGDTAVGHLFQELKSHIETLWTAIESFNNFVTTATPADLATEPGVITPDPATKGFKFVPTGIAHGGASPVPPGPRAGVSGDKASPGEPKNHVPAEKSSASGPSAGSRKPRQG